MVDNLTQTQFATLSTIKEIGECSQSDLVRSIALDSATVNEAIGEGITAETLAHLTPTERTRLLRLLRKMMNSEKTNAGRRTTRGGPRPSGTAF
jgi:hypothetical protein